MVKRSRLLMVSRWSPGWVAVSPAAAIGRGSYRLSVESFGVFIRARAAGRGGTSGRGLEKVGTGWHTRSAGTSPKYSFLPDKIYCSWAVLPDSSTCLCYSRMLP